MVSGAVFLLLGFGMVIITFALSEWGGLPVFVLGSILASGLVASGLILLCLPSVFGWGRAVLVGILLYVGGGLVSWFGPLAAVNAPLSWGIVWPFFLFMTHGCFVRPSLWHCFPR